VPDLSGRELLSEWRKLMDSVVASAASVGSRTEIPRQLLEPMQRQIELLQEVIERERALQREITGRVLAPVDAIFDLVEESGQVLRRQAEALESAGRALEDTARLVQTQAELFEHAIGALRQPTELAKVAAGLPRRPAKKTAPKKPAQKKPAPEASTRSRASG
jgi:ABC-type transporter Mla subunit MlaD